MLNRSLGFVILISFFPPDLGLGDERPTAKEVQQGLAKAAGDYVILRAGSPTRLELNETPVLKWTNPERSEQQGVVFVWHEDGLPLAIGSFFTFEYRGLRVKHEFHSLSDSPLSAAYRQKNAWSPKKPGVSWTAATEHGAPHRSKVFRLTQMKQIAGSFEVTLIDPSGDRRKLRLLRTPLLRFESPSHNVVDGAIFSYTVATDPEAMLLVRSNGDHWEYAFARFHYWQLEARRNGTLDWSAPLDQGLERNRLGDQSHVAKEFISFYPEVDYLFRP